MGLILRWSHIRAHIHAVTAVMELRALGGGGGSVWQSGDYGNEKAPSQSGPEGDGQAREKPPGG